MTDTINHLLHFLYNIVRFGEYYIAIHYYLVGILSLLVLFALTYRLMMSGKAPKNLTDIRRKALQEKTKDTSSPPDDLWREVREMRLRMEILTDEIRLLRRDLKGPPAYAQDVAPNSRRALAPPPMPNTSYAILSSDYE